MMTNIHFRKTVINPMARYSSEHKARSRDAIIASAARAFRQHGFSGVGIDQLCRQAGLTRGTFYAHFSSKAELLAAVLQGPHDLVQRLRARVSRKTSALAKAGARVSQDYLHPKHRPAVLAGCSLASLAMDAVRGSAQTQAAYASAIENVVQEFQRAGVSSDNARAAAALCIGGLLVAGACGDNPVADGVAKSASKRVQALLTTDL